MEASGGSQGANRTRRECKQDPARCCGITRSRRITRWKKRWGRTGSQGQTGANRIRKVVTEAMDLKRRQGTADAPRSMTHPKVVTEAMGLRRRLADRGVRGGGDGATNGSARRARDYGFQRGGDGPTGPRELMELGEQKQQTAVTCKDLRALTGTSRPDGPGKDLHEEKADPRKDLQTLYAGELGGCTDPQGLRVASGATGSARISAGFPGS